MAQMQPRHIPASNAFFTEAENGGACIAEEKRQATWKCGLLRDPIDVRNIGYSIFENYTSNKNK